MPNITNRERRLCTKHANILLRDTLYPIHVNDSMMNERSICPIVAAYLWILLRFGAYDTNYCKTG